MASRRQFTGWSSAAPTPDPAAELVATRHRAELAEQRVELLERQVADMRTAMRILAFAFGKTFGKRSFNA